MPFDFWSKLISKDMKYFKWTWLVAFIAASQPVAAQTLLLDPANHRFLINEKSSEPRLDLIVQKLPASKHEIARQAVIDTVTKPVFSKISHCSYQVNAGRMGERLILVIRNAEKLKAGYLLEINGNPVTRGDDNDEVSSYLLNGEQCQAAGALPFGSDSLTILLSDAQHNPVSRISIAYFFPKPELLYIDIAAHANADIADTTGLRRFLHHYNKTKTTYKPGSSVPDSLVIAEAEVYFGFKKAFYDGKIRRSRIAQRIGKTGQWNGTLLEWTPYTQLINNSEDWNYKPDGDYEIQFAYNEAGNSVGSYPFKIRHHWFANLMYYTTSVSWIVTAVLFTYPWIAFILLSVVGYFYFRKRLKKSRNLAKKANLELQAVQSQLNPHFVFNALGSLQALINKNEIERANVYLTGFSKLMRSTLNNSGKEMVPVQVEISNIENYVRLEQLRFGFVYDIRVDDAVRNAQVEVPSLLIQPVVENAIKHGISAMGDLGKLVITFTIEKNDLEIRVKDNGKGFDKNMISTGKGLALTRERIKLLNKQGFRIAMEINSGEGTEVKFTFEKWL
jgi:hypothetical protein